MAAGIAVLHLMCCAHALLQLCLFIADTAPSSSQLKSIAERVVLCVIDKGVKENVARHALKSV